MRRAQMTPYPPSDADERHIVIEESFTDSFVPILEKEFVQGSRLSNIWMNEVVGKGCMGALISTGNGRLSLLHSLSAVDPEELYRSIPPSYNMIRGRPREDWGVSFHQDEVVSRTEMMMSVGPVHAGTIGPGRFLFQSEGEPIERLQVRLGFSHRDAEGLSIRVGMPRSLYIVERMSGDNAVAHASSFCMALESGSEIPLRARFLRTIMAELERIHCHLADMGGMAQDVAFVVPAQRIFALKERVLRLNDSVFRHRLLWGNIVPGGCRHDPGKPILSSMQKELISIGLDFEELMDVMMQSASFQDRIETTGIVPMEWAKEMMLCGPTARASGICHDVRGAHPYAAYGYVGMRVPVRQEGDVLSRFQLRGDELKESISIIGQCLEMMDDGPVLSPGIRSPDGWYNGMTESPRGEVVHTIRIQGGRLVHHSAKDPSMNNWCALERAVRGNIVPDFPLMNKSFNLSYSGNDM